MKIIAISGGIDTCKDKLAYRLAENSDVVYIKPYTDREVPINLEVYEQDDLIHLSSEKLSRKMEREIPLTMETVNGNRYVFFKNQCTADFCVMILDDAGIFNLKKNWSGEIITVRVHSKNERSSSRVLMKDSEYDFVFDWDKDDYHDLETAIEYR